MDKTWKGGVQIDALPRSKIDRKSGRGVRTLFGISVLATRKARNRTCSLSLGSGSEVAGWRSEFYFTRLNMLLL